MADISFRWNRDEHDLKDAFDKVVAEERTRDPDIKEGAIAKKLMHRGLDADAERGRAAAIAEGDLAAIKGQVNQIAQSVRKLEVSMTTIREDLANTVLVLLVHAGKLSAEKAEKWVKEQFKS